MQALARLLLLAERSDIGQAARVARFLTATYDGAAFNFELFDLRAVDVHIPDDMPSCLDVLRWATSILCY